MTVSYSVGVRVAVAAVAFCTVVAISSPAYAVDPTIAAVGDMACNPGETAYNGGNGTATRCRQRYVSDLVVNPLPAALLDLGDNQYLHGELANYNAVYDPTFGRANSVVYPSLGNAEYGTPNAQGFFDFFQSQSVFSRIQAGSGDSSHLLSEGYYSFDIGGWHLIALNSNCAEVGGCGINSPQELWLKADLAAHPDQCTLAYWHHPRWNSGSLGNDSRTAAFWTDLYTAGADIVLNGHGNHHYERSALVSAGGVADSKGIRQFIVSTGGESHGTPPATPGNGATVQATDYTSFGVLRLALHPTGYDWQFVPEVGGSFTDAGTGACHAGTPAALPDAPSLSAVAGDGAVSLSWKPPASDGGAAITGYRIYRGTSAGTDTLLTSVGSVGSYLDTTAVNGTTYFYRVAAVNSVGAGAASAEVSVAPTAAGLPRAPVLDSFDRPAGPLGANWRSPALSDTGTVSIASTGLTAGSAGASSAAWSATTFPADQEVVLTLATLPRAGNFLQLAGRVSTLGTSGLSAYLLRVTPSTGTWDIRRKINGAISTSIQTFTAPLNAGDGIALQLVGPTLNVYRRPAGGAWAKVGSAADAALSAAGYAVFTLGDTSARASSFGAGAWTSAERPGAATLAASAGDGSVSLSWSAPASDGGAPITAYKVYRGPPGGSAALLTSVGNVTSYNDTSAVNGTGYSYRVAAVNRVGEGALSNQVTATPTAASPAPPSTGVLDAFDRAAGPLGANWQSRALTDAGTVSIASPGLASGSTGASSAAWSVTRFGADQEGYLTVPVLPTAGNFLQVAGRLNTLTATGVSCYFLRVTPSSNTWEVRKKLNGALSTSIRTFTASFNAGDTMALQLRGSALAVFRKPAGGAWSLVGSVTDSTITSTGYLAFTLGDTTARAGGFGGGQL